MIGPADREVLTTRFNFGPLQGVELENKQVSEDLHLWQEVIPTPVNDVKPQFWHEVGGMHVPWARALPKCLWFENLELYSVSVLLIPLRLYDQECVNSVVVRLPPSEHVETLVLDQVLSRPPVDLSGDSF